MKKNYYHFLHPTPYTLLLAVLILLYPIPYTLHPAFKDSGWGARAGGMGNAFTAISDDSSGISCNPSGIARLENPEGTFMYNKLFWGLDNVNLGLMQAGFVYPVQDIGTFGLNINDMYLSSLYREDTFAVAYANDIASFFWDKVPPFPIYGGVSAKYFLHKYILDARTKLFNDPVFEDGTSAGAFTVDCGVLIVPGKLSIGLAAKNIVPADVGLYHEDIVPAEYRLGVAYKFEKWKFFEVLLPSLDFSYRKPLNNDADIKISGGVESWFSNHTYAARLGGSDRDITAGFSFNKDILNLGCQLDYAFLWPLQLEDTSGSHRLSLTFRPAVSKKGSKSEDRESEDSGGGIIIPQEAQPSAETIEPPSPPVQHKVVQEEEPFIQQDEQEELKKQYYENAYKHYMEVTR